MFSPSHGCRTLLLSALLALLSIASSDALDGRERISINDEWRFHRTAANQDGLIYDNRPDTVKQNITTVLKPWILPAGNEYIKDPSKHHIRPDGNPGSDVPFVQPNFDDSTWESVNLPHDWAIRGPFYQGANVPVRGGMGRLPVHGVGWYRRKLSFTSEDKNRSVYLDIDGAMSYAIVFLNGKLVGGWPYGYQSFRLDLTPYLVDGEDNQLAIRVDNPTDSSRWYPGGGIYRNVWVTKANKVHVKYSGTYITSRKVSENSAVLDLVVSLENKANASRQVEVVTEVFGIDELTGEAGEKVATFPRDAVRVTGGQAQQLNGSVTIEKPQLWGPVPSQTPNLYVAVTRLYVNDNMVDTYETRFGIRSITWDANRGLLVNGEHIRLQGVNQHHDLGALGSAFNHRAAQRQLEVLHELGCNAIRMSHNPPAPELLELTDQMGFVVIDEIFDQWYQNKTNSDFHLIFPDWHEPDLRAFLRRDRNHPSVVAWSVGNEVSEQYTNETGAAVARTLVSVAHEEDPTRHVTASMNYAKPYMPFPREFDLLNVNYQGEGIRDAPAYSHLKGIETPPQYSAFHEAFPEKSILASESAAALSTRGTYIFPVVEGIAAPVNDTSGGNSTSKYVSAYELYSSDFGASADKVFVAQDNNSFVAGEFVWSGWDYLGEPTPYYDARSSYFGVIDLAGFKKDRFYLYQSRWRPDLKFAHILPHWTWPQRVGQVTPVHVFSAADEAELFLNGESLGRKTNGASEYRFRWDDVKYQPGELKVVTFKDGAEWAESTVETVGDAAGLEVAADRTNITADGLDLSFVSVKVVDVNGNIVPEAANTITFSITGPGELVATDNGDPTDFSPFPSKDRKAFSGLALAIVRASGSGSITVKVSGPGLEGAEIIVEARNGGTEK